MQKNKIMQLISVAPRKELDINLDVSDDGHNFYTESFPCIALALMGDGSVQRLFLKGAEVVTFEELDRQYGISPDA